MPGQRIEDAADVDPLFRADLPQVPAGEIDTPATQAQAEIEGKPFNRDIAGQNDDQQIMQERVVRVVAGQEEKTGTTIFRTLNELPKGLHPSDLPHLTPQQADTHFDRANEGSPMLPTARKRGASTAHVNTKALIRGRGGNPDHRTPKHEQGGWGFPKERKRVRNLKKSGRI